MADRLPFGEGASINRSPLFCGLNYQFWKVRMEIFMESLDKGIWDAIENGPFVPKFVFRPVDRDVFVHDLNRQLGSPSRWLSPRIPAKKGQRGALAAVCTPTLKSASKKHQKTVHLRI